MALSAEPHACTAIELAAALRRREVSAGELLALALARAEAWAPLRAVVAFERERATADAAAADARLARGEPCGPLDGVPMTVKDTYDTAGHPTTNGVPWLRHNRPAGDAALVARLRAAGAVIFAKTSCPLASYDWQCVHPHAGRACNPWDMSRTPGGSSGGGAAALAARITPLELGSDVAGSIRVPAHYCGVFGLRPTEGALSTAGHAAIPGHPPTLRNFMACGPMARDIGDLRLLLACLWGPAPSDLPLEYARAPAATLRGARIAVAEAWGPASADAATRATLADVVRALRDAGAEVIEDAPELAHAELWRLWGALQGYELGGQMPWPARIPVLGPGALALGYAARFGAGPMAGSLARGWFLSRLGYARALARRAELMAAYDAFLRKFDAWLTPTTPGPAFTHRRTGARVEVDGVKVRYEVACAAWAIPTAIGGHPAAVAPAGLSPEGLPIGLQWHARRGADERLLALLAAVEAVRPWRPRWPVLADRQGRA